LVIVIAGIQNYRQRLKIIREKELNLTVTRDKKRHLESKQNGSHRSSSKGKGIELTKEFSSLEQECRAQEQDLADYKRFAVREAFYVRFNALTEYAEKLAMIAGFGKYLVDQIPIEPTPYGQPRQPYTGSEQTSTIIEDAIAAIDGWRPTEQDERPTMDLPDRHSSFDTQRRSTTASMHSYQSSEDFDSSSFVDSPSTEHHPPPLPTRPSRSRQSAPPLPPHPSVADLPPSYHESNLATPIPSAPEQPIETPEDTEFLTPHQAHGQVYQLPNEATSPVLSHFSSDQPSNYNQLYRQISQRQGHTQRPYLEYRAQQQERIGAGGFRFPSHQQSYTVLSAEEEKRELAERERLKELPYQQSKPSYSGSSAPPYWSMPPPVHDQPYHIPPDDGMTNSTAAHRSSGSSREQARQSGQPPQYHQQ
jgi:Eisosome component PIL1